MKSGRVMIPNSATNGLKVNAGRGINKCYCYVSWIPNLKQKRCR